MDDIELETWLAKPTVKEILRPVRELQKVLLELLQVFDKLCTKHHLRYYLYYGTLLGAVRHQGFIPWDDDADVVMPREDYDKFLEICATDLPEGYFLQWPQTDLNSRFCFAKLRKNGTACMCQNHCHIRMHQGIFIDIFPFESPRHGLENIMWTGARIIDKLTAFSCAKLPRRMKFLRPFQIIWQIFLKPSFFAMLENLFVKLFEGENDKYYCPTCSEVTQGEASGWPKRCFEPSRRVPFENVFLNIPFCADELLVAQYGDWRELPAEECRIPVHSRSGIVSTSRDYKEFLESANLK